ncbi:UNVERIFIED_CONTAM: hypothetical protein K2H54_001324 [Gekko kuhli]
MQNKEMQDMPLVDMGQIPGEVRLKNFSLEVGLVKSGDKELMQGEMFKVAKKGARCPSGKSIRYKREIKTELKRQKKQNIEANYQKYKELRHVSMNKKRRLFREIK